MKAGKLYLFLLILLGYSGISHAQCSITGITAGTQSACNPLTNYYSQQVTVTYSGSAGFGSLVVNGQTFAATGSPQTVTLTSLEANGAPVNVTASFTDDPACTLTVTSLFTAPVDCLPNDPGQIDDFQNCNYSTANGLVEYYFDYSSNADTSSNIVLQFVGQQGECCNLPTNNNCYLLELFLNPNSEGISFNFIDGPSGSLTIYEPCATGPGTTYGLGDIICVSGVGPHEFMICRPGNANDYLIEVVSYPTPSGTGDLGVTEGCFIDLSVQGLDPASIIWNSTAPGTNGQWNNLLSGGSANGISGVPYATTANGGNLSAGVEDVVVTPVTGSPSVVSYQVCGYPLLGSVCSNTPPVLWCNTTTITIYPDLFTDAGTDLAICQGAAPGTTVAAIGTVTGGTPPFTFNWQGVSGAATGFNYTATSTDATQTVNLSLVGTYTLTVTDANNCATATDQVTVFEYDTQIESFITSPSVTTCFFPTPTVNLQGYVTETNQGVWSSSAGGTFGNANVTSGALPGTSTTWTPTAGTTGTVTLTLTPTNTLGCPSTPATVTVNLTQFTSVLTSPPINVNCNGANNGSINLTVTPGSPAYATSSYSWSGPSGYVSAAEDISGLAPGTYTVTVTDVNGCTATSSASITQPTILTSSNTPSNVTCNGGSNGSASVTASGGTAPYNVSWIGTSSGNPAGNEITTSGGNYTITGLVAGNYTVTVTDANGCTSTSSLTITQPLLLTSGNTPTNVLCSGGSDGTILMTTSGGTAPY
ncbi:MAG: SprB repeat-containing protein, partial [Cryomorphaceae bacterium]|nr:SprB repeat-containing protein [Cryomorphaceae bacterium]